MRLLAAQPALAFARFAIFAVKIRSGFTSDVECRRKGRMLPAMSLSALSARAQRVRQLYATLETKRGGRPWTRAELAQGFVGDVGDLMKLLMARDGLRPVTRLTARLRHEFGDCLWSLLVLAEACDVDLEAAFHSTMNELERRLRPRRVTVRRRTKTAKTSRGRRR